MIPAYDNIIKVGSQELVPIADYYRFVLQEVMPEKGFKFKFGIRDRVIDECLKRFKRLEVRFSEFPDLSFNLNPLEWQNLGEVKKQIGLFKNDPMKFYWFFVGFNNQLVPAREKQSVGQGVLNYETNHLAED
jgi:hypothetical protein